MDRRVQRPFISSKVELMQRLILKDSLKPRSFLAPFRLSIGSKGLFVRPMEPSLQDFVWVEPLGMRTGPAALPAAKKITKGEFNASTL